MTIRGLGRVKMYQNKKEDPRPINAFWTTLIILMSVSFNGLNIKVANNIIDIIRKESTGIICDASKIGIRNIPNIATG